MTKAKSLLLGSAAALATVSGAQAADLGLPVAAVNYVQICSIGSFTGFLLPGSDVCFDISGYARGQLTWSEEIDPFAWETGDAITLFSALGDTAAAQPWGPTVGATVTIAAGTPLPNAPTQAQLDTYNLQMRNYAAQIAGLSVRSLTSDDGYDLNMFDNVLQGHNGTTIVDASAGNGTIIGDIAAVTGALQFDTAGAAASGFAADDDYITGLSILAAAGDNDENDFTGNARLNFDARTMTEYGLLRGFIRLDGENGNAANVDRAFVQMNVGSLGFTAGLADSVFDPVFTGYGSGAANGLDIADQASNQFSVNFAAGNGFTLSFSIEDDDARTGSILGLAESRVVLDATTGNGGLWTLSEVGYDGGASAPDFIAALRVDQAWGSAKLGAALHEVNPAGSSVDSEWGFAVSGSAELNIPFGVGSTFGITAIYANGAQQFHGFDNTIGDTVNGYADAIVVTVDTDTAVATTSLELTESYMIAAGFNFGLNDYVAVSLDGSYADVDHFGGMFDGSVYHIRGGIAYTPVTNLTINAHVTYSQSDFEISDFRSDVDDDEWSARFRVTRSF
ncbi:MAG: porin [Cohaesibacteraceae bacterium]